MMLPLDSTKPRFASGCNENSRRDDVVDAICGDLPARPNRRHRRLLRKAAVAADGQYTFGFLTEDELFDATVAELDKQGVIGTTLLWSLFNWVAWALLKYFIRMYIQHLLAKEEVLSAPLTCTSTCATTCATTCTTTCTQLSLFTDDDYQD